MSVTEPFPFLELPPELWWQLRSFLDPLTRIYLKWTCTLLASDDVKYRLPPLLAYVYYLINIERPKREGTIVRCDLVPLKAGIPLGIDAPCDIHDPFYAPFVNQWMELRDTTWFRWIEQIQVGVIGPRPYLKRISWSTQPSFEDERALNIEIAATCPNDKKGPHDNAMTVIDDVLSLTPDPNATVEHRILIGHSQNSPTDKWAVVIARCGRCHPTPSQCICLFFSTLKELVKDTEEQIYAFFPVK